MVTCLSRPYRVTPLLMGAVLLFSTMSVSAQTTLRWKFQKGQRFEQTITQNTTLLAVAALQIPDRALNQIIEAAWTVGNVDAQGTAEVTQEIKRIRMKIGSQTEIDSTSTQELQGPAAQIAQAIQAMAKAKIQMKMNPLGEILDVELSQDTLDALTSLPKLGAVGSIFNKDTLVDMIKKSAQTLSQEAVRKGAAWSSTAEIPAGQPGKVAYQTKKMTYVGQEKAGDKLLERIEMEVITSLEKGLDSPAKKTPSVPSGNAAGIKVQGVLFFDNLAGRLDHSELVQETTMPMSVGDKKYDQKTRTSIQVVMKPITQAKL